MYNVYTCKHMNENKPSGRIIVNLNEHHGPLKEAASKHDVPMGKLARDLIAAGLKRLKSGQDKFSTSAIQPTDES